MERPGWARFAVCAAGTVSDWHDKCHCRTLIKEKGGGKVKIGGPADRGSGSGGKEERSINRR